MIPGGRAKIPQATGRGQKKKNTQDGNLKSAGLFDNILVKSCPFLAYAGVTGTVWGKLERLSTTAEFKD